MTCQKITYETKVDANTDILRIKSNRQRFSKRCSKMDNCRKLTPYKCPCCGLWHTTSLAKTVSKRLSKGVAA